MKWTLFVSMLALVVASFAPAFSASAQQQSIDFPQSNYYVRTTPGVLFCDQRNELVLEVTIVRRPDVKRVFITDSAGGIPVRDDNAPGVTYGEMFDDGENDDAKAGDRVFTRRMSPPCDIGKWGYGVANLYLRVEFANGQFGNSWYPINVGVVANQYRGVFDVKDFGNGLSATAYAFFIEDPKGEVIGSFPLANVMCGVTNFMAYRKLYSVLPDAFDFALVTPGLQVFRPGDFVENIPYAINVSNRVENIGMKIFDNTKMYGSAGRLKTVIYDSFGYLDVVDHEILHAWGTDLGKSLGLIDTDSIFDGFTFEGHWNEYTDIGGQLQYFYVDSIYGSGHFTSNGNGTWTFTDKIKGNMNQPYSPLELYIMGLIPPKEVPPVHILSNPKFYSQSRVIPESYKTITIEDIMRAQGGPRNPPAETSQKDFTMAYIVVQDIPFNEAGYAYASLMAYHLTSKNPPDNRSNSQYRFFMPFYWATGGRSTLETRLPVDLPEPLNLPNREPATPTPTIQATAAPESTAEPEPTTLVPPTAPAPDEQPTPPAESAPPAGCSMLPLGLVLLPGAWHFWRQRKTIQTH
jgi:hypothetical protein